MQMVILSFYKLCGTKHWCYTKCTKGRKHVQHSCAHPTFRWQTWSELKANKRWHVQLTLRMTSHVNLCAVTVTETQHNPHFFVSNPKLQLAGLKQQWRMSTCLKESVSMTKFNTGGAVSHRCLYDSAQRITLFVFIQNYNLCLKSTFKSRLHFNKVWISVERVMSFDVSPTPKWGLWSTIASEHDQVTPFAALQFSWSHRTECLVFLLPPTSSAGFGFHLWKNQCDQDLLESFMFCKISTACC